MVPVPPYFMVVHYISVIAAGGVLRASRRFIQRLPNGR
jgi:hypothetical protein